MKKVLSLLLAAAMCTSVLAGCGNSAGDTADTSSDNGAESTGGCI